jgi:hypothetical protein
MNKEKRWALAKLALSLSDDQVARLRETVVQRDRELEGKAFIVTRFLERLPMTTAAGDTDELMTHAYGDALAAADAAFDARVAKVLSPEQLSKWTKTGFARVFGRQLPVLPPSDARAQDVFRVFPPDRVSLPTPR